MYARPHGRSRRGAYSITGSRAGFCCPWSACSPREAVRRLARIPGFRWTDPGLAIHRDRGRCDRGAPTRVPPLARIPRRYCSLRGRSRLSPVASIPRGVPRREALLFASRLDRHCSTALGTWAHSCADVPRGGVLLAARFGPLQRLKPARGRAVMPGETTRRVLSADRLPCATAMRPIALARHGANEKRGLAQFGRSRAR